MSPLQRLLLSDRIFFVTVSLRRALAPLWPCEYEQMVAAIKESREKLGFLLPYRG